MDKFEIGEIAIIIQCTDTKSIGKECEIISAKYEYDGEIGYDIDIPGDYCHRKDSVNGEWFIGESYLKKRRPPTELSTWEEVEADMGWNPTKQSVTIRNNDAICNEGE